MYTRFGLLAGTGGLGGSNRSSDLPLTVEVELEDEYDLWVCTSGAMATGLLVVCSVVT